jgi:transmembrane sensor
VEKLLPHIDALIVKYLDGSSSPEENMLLHDWRKLSPANEKYFNDMKFLFEQSAGVKKNITVNTESAWQKVHQQMILANSHKQQSSALVWKIAASVALILVAGYFVFTMFGSNSTSGNFALHTTTKTITKILNDGSKLRLEPNSTLKSLGKNREYELTGTARFTVTHNEEEPFIIHTRNLLIEDVGTVFTVNAEKSIDSTVVTVSSGSVKLYTGNQQGILLNKGETGIYNHKTHVFTKHSMQTFEGVKLANMNFVNATLNEVVYKINRHFKSEIVIDQKSAGNCLITVRFNQSKLDDMVRIITETLNLRAVKSKNKTILVGNACAE